MQPEPEHPTNVFGQPTGRPVPNWRSAGPLSDAPMQGRFCRLERFDAERHLELLFDAYAPDDERWWTYLPWERPVDIDQLAQLIALTADRFQRFVILTPDSREALGEASYMRHAPQEGSVEVGGVRFGPRLRRASAATEAMHLMMRRAFEAGYRRYEWKCDALNAASRAAALRLGFEFEGVFRQERVIKGRNRDTAWFSVIDREWPAIRRATAQWLDPANFDEQGRQRQRLAALIEREKGRELEDHAA